MPRLALLRPIPLLCLLAACHSGEAPAPAVPAAAPEPKPAAVAPADAADEVVRGQFVIGKDGYGITLCGEQTQRMVGLAPEAEAFIAKFSAGGAREFFVDGRGSAFTDTGRRLVRIERAYTEGPGCDERAEPMRFKAHGNEPFWSVTVEEAALRFETPEAPVRSVPIASTEGEAGTQRFAGGEGADRIELELRQAPCSDGMSDTLYGWTATAQAGGRTWQGCAFAGQ